MVVCKQPQNKNGRPMVAPTNKFRQRDCFLCRFCDIMVWVMNMDELKKRKTPRYQSFDYNSSGVYFITICTQNRRCILSRIVGTGVPDCPQIELTKYGQVADKYIKQLNDFYNHLSVEKYVIMPNHIHLLLWVKENKYAIENGQSRTPVPTNIERANSACSQFVSTFKRFCNKEYITIAMLLIDSHQHLQIKFYCLAF